jgi:hypothetical protein
VSINVMEATAAPPGRLAVTVVVPWPRYPTETPGGKLSLSKIAGTLVPYLSANVAHNMHRARFAEARALWRDAAEKAAKAGGFVLVAQTPALIVANLHKPTAIAMDSWAVLEGAKYAVDGLVRAGVLPDDTTEHVRGGIGMAFKAATREVCLELKVWPL